jgi:hypothetical protein
VKVSASLRFHHQRPISPSQKSSCELFASTSFAVEGAESLVHTRGPFSALALSRRWPFPSPGMEHVHDVTKVRLQSKFGGEVEVTRDLLAQASPVWRDTFDLEIVDPTQPTVVVEDCTVSDILAFNHVLLVGSWAEVSKEM